MRFDGDRMNMRCCQHYLQTSRDKIRMFLRSFVTNLHTM